MSFRHTGTREFICKHRLTAVELSTYPLLVTVYLWLRQTCFPLLPWWVWRNSMEDDMSATSDYLIRPRRELAHVKHLYALRYRLETAQKDNQQAEVALLRFAIKEFESVEVRA